MRFLIAGVGSIGQRHIRNLRALLGDGVELLAYRVRGRTDVLTDSMEVEAGRRVEEQYGLRVFDDLERALGAQPDAVFVCNPTSQHMKVALAAARANSHLFIEKPLSDRCDSVEELIGLVARRNLVAMVGYQLRFHPGLVAVRSLLAQRAIGQVVSVRAEVGEYLPGAHPYEDYRSSYAGRADLGGGVILSQSHELDYLQWLFGTPRRVFAVGGHLSDLEIDVEDAAGILIECEVDGKAIPIHLSLDFVQRPPTRTLHITGDAGRIFLDFGNAALDVFDDRGQAICRDTFGDLPRNQLFVDELAHFLSCLSGVSAPCVTLSDAAGSLRTALAARESLRSGRSVDLA